MRKITNISSNLVQQYENKSAISASLDYMLDDCKIAYVFADGHLLEIIFE